MFRRWGGVISRKGDVHEEGGLFVVGAVLITPLKGATLREMPL